MMKERDIYYDFPTHSITPVAPQDDVVPIVKEDLAFLNGKGFLLYNVLSPKECKYYMSQFDSGSFEAASLDKRYRNSDRMVFNCNDLSSLIFLRIKPFLVSNVDVEQGKEMELSSELGTVGKWDLDHLNYCFRLCRYSPGGHFAPHFDGNFVKSVDMRSFYTFMVYLNGREDFEGGATNFLGDNQVLYVNPETQIFQGTKENVLKAVVPQAGMALIFLHPIMHEGEQVIGGMKYILRTDIMYKRDASVLVDEDPKEIEARRLFRLASEMEKEDPMKAVQYYSRATKLSATLAKAYGLR